MTLDILRPSADRLAREKWSIYFNLSMNGWIVVLQYHAHEYRKTTKHGWKARNPYAIPRTAAVVPDIPDDVLTEAKDRIKAALDKARVT